MDNGIKDKRQAEGLSVVKFARMMNVTTVTVWRWERGELNVDIETLQQMARLLKTTPLDLVPTLAESPAPEPTIPQGTRPELKEPAHA